MKSSNVDFINSYSRELGVAEMNMGIGPEEAKKYYNSVNHETYFVEYIGDFLGDITTIDFAHIFIINAFFAILFVEEGRISEVLERFPGITNIERNFPYLLSNLDEGNEIPDPNAINKGGIPLDGTGVVVGIIGTGVDYLNPRFMDENGRTRIISIWDQSINEGPIPLNFFRGREYTRDEINRAIEAQKAGNNPYDIVNHRDEVGYSTAIATIIGGRKLDEFDNVVSVAPKCEFVVVKLVESRIINRAHWGLLDFKGLLYDSFDVATSIRYFSQTQQRINKPMVIYSSIGTNLGAHDGSTLGERYVDFFTRTRGFSVVASTGNQGGSPICYKGNFTSEEVEKIIDIKVDENQKNLFFSLYFTEPDRISVGLTSPAGEIINKIPINFINGEEINITLGETSIFVQYFVERKSTRDQRLDFVMRNVSGGIWKLNIVKDYAIHGTLNVWFQQKEFSIGDTGLLQSTPYTTLMTPATANNIIVTSSYNQIENVIMEDSGRGFTTDNRIIPSVALPAKNVLTVGLNNKPMVVSGSAVSGAILTGIVALLYQWGLVQGNDLNMYSSKIKSYIMQSTIRKEEEVYPNPETGFGILSIEKLFEILYKRVVQNSCIDNIKNPGLYINIPKEVYKKLRFH